MTNKQTRSSNGQFLKGNSNDSTSLSEGDVPKTVNISVSLCINIILSFIFLIPMFYHIFIRKNFLTWLVEFLNSEFGCTPCMPCPPCVKGDEQANMDIK